MGAKFGEHGHPDGVIAALRDTVHYDADFERLAMHTDLTVAVEALAPFGSLP